MLRFFFVGFGGTGSFFGVPLWFQDGTIGGAAMDVVEGEAPYFFRREPPHFQEGRRRAFWDSSLFGCVFLGELQLSCSDFVVLPWVLPAHVPPMCSYCLKEPQAVARSTLQAPENLATVRRDFSTGCITDDNIATLVRMPNASWARAFGGSFAGRNR